MTPTTDAPPQNAAVDVHADTGAAQRSHQSALQRTTPNSPIAQPLISDDAAAGVEAQALAEDDTVRRPLTPVGERRDRWREGWQSRLRPRFQLRQEFIGRVDDVDEETFRATLVTRSEPDEQEVAEIEIEEVSPRDRHLLTPGRIFYWVIGYRDEAYGQRRGVSSIHFRKLVNLSAHQEQIADERAARWGDLLDAGEDAR
jgi:hypothetical protein